MEYFRWRLSDDPSAPTQATLYNLLPGGWAEVLDTFGEFSSGAAPGG